LLNEEVNSLYRVLDKYVPSSVISKKNGARTWLYGYDEKYDMVIISKTGQIGDIISIEGLTIALPLLPKDIIKRSDKRSEQYWEREELPNQLDKIQSIFQWNDMPSDFKNKWVDYIESEFDRREYGAWFMNNGDPTYITGSHYMYQDFLLWLHLRL